MTGRNQPCPCGSGKKFKRCHGSSGQPGAAAKSDGTIDQARRLAENGQSEAALALLAGTDTADSCAVQVGILIARNDPGDLEHADRLIQTWKTLDPSQPQAWARDLELEIYRQNPDKVRRALAALQNRAPLRPKTVYYQALVEHLFGEFENAWPCYLDAAKRAYPGFSASAVTAVAAIRACRTETGSHPGTRKRNDRALLAKPALTELLHESLKKWEDESGSVASAPSDEIEWITDGWYLLGTVTMLGFYPARFSVHCLERVLRWNPQHRLARSNLLMALNYCAVSSPQEIFAYHKAAGDFLKQSVPERKRQFFNSRKSDRPLRVAYLSADFRRHPVAHFIIPVLEHHDSSRVRTFLYHTSQHRDELTERAAKAANQIFYCWDIDDPGLASQIERDQVDILVDLTGATGSGRLGLLAARAAPVQMTWLGYPNSTGLETVDYRLVDEVTDPSPQADALCSEKLLRLPHQFSVYSPLEELPAITHTPTRPGQAIVFGSFNNLAKINDGLVSCWADLLAAVPGSRLLLKDYAFDDPNVCQRMRDWFSTHQADPSRLDFLGTVENKNDHLATYNQIDIHLDSFPYNGTTTTCDSLLMGVPVVTQTGNDHRSRVSTSLLRSAGFPQWAAEGREHYLEIARQLTHDRQALSGLRQTMRQQILASPLLDARQFTLDLEQAYRQCWEDWCRNYGSAA